jgi:hypothetical protein
VPYGGRSTYSGGLGRAAGGGLGGSAGGIGIGIGGITCRDAAGGLGGARDCDC